MHEIITIQIGNQSNFIGTHFWNAQESYFTYGPNEESVVNHDISFRSGIGADGADTYTPRTLVYDVKESFGTLRQLNALYQLQNEDEEPLHNLGGSPSVIRQPPIPHHPYQQYLETNTAPPILDSSNIRYWSDYNRVFYHPRSLVQLQAGTVTSSLSPLNSWSSGTELFDTDDKEYDILDRDFRFFAEECDQLQGVTIIAGVDNAWGGFAARYVENLRDELGKGTIWVWGVDETLKAAEDTRERRLLRLSNSIRSTNALGTNASLYTPLVSAISHSPDYLTIDPGSAWETSALQAALIETMSLPTRLKSSQGSRTVMSEYEQLFTASAANRKILQADMSKETDLVQTNGVTTNGHSDESHDERITNRDTENSSNDKRLDMSFFPTLRSSNHPALRPHLFDRLSIVRGVAQSHNSVSGREDPYAPTMLQFSSTLAFPSSLSSYPQIFGSNESNASESGVSLHASLSANSTVATWLRAMADNSRRVLSIDDREDISSSLRTWADDYIEGWESADDEDDSE